MDWIAFPKIRILYQSETLFDLKQKYLEYIELNIEQHIKNRTFTGQNTANEKQGCCAKYMIKKSNKYNWSASAFMDEDHKATDIALVIN